MDDDWRHRLQMACDKDSRSNRSISLSVGLGSQYLYQILEGKTPSTTNMIALCSALNVDLTYILTGETLPPELKDMADLFTKLTPDNREILLKVARGFIENQPSTR